MLGAAAADDLALDVPGDLGLGVALHVAHQREGRSPLRHRLTLVRRVEGYGLCKGENESSRPCHDYGRTELINVKNMRRHSNVLLGR